MRVTFNLSTLSQTKPYEYAIRFLFGGAITVLAGILAKEFGPVIGGLFLAFPAIFPASATLLEKHQREKKKKAGIAETIRGAQRICLSEGVHPKKLCPILCHTWLKICAAEVLHGSALRFHADVRVAFHHGA
jgi:hypothetical protein